MPRTPTTRGTAATRILHSIQTTRSLVQELPRTTQDDDWQDPAYLLIRALLSLANDQHTHPKPTKQQLAEFNTLLEKAVTSRRNTRLTHKQKTPPQ